jgi:hypothetical protein
MAEWLGGLMASWPTWLIGVAIIILSIIAGFYYIYFDNVTTPELPSIRRKKHGKK